MKICTKCQKTKKDSAFYPNKRDGHNRWCKECCRAWKQANIDKMRAYRKKNYQLHGITEARKKRQLTQRNIRRRYLYKTDVMYRLESNFRRALRGCLSGRNRHSKSMWLLQYSIEDLKKHLQSLFQEGMNWGNYGKWHIDHIKPISSFCWKSVNDVEFQECWALKNLQPLWAADNLKKSNKYLNPAF